LPPKDILGVVFHVITPAVDRSANLYVSAQPTNIHPVAREGSVDHRVFRAFGKALEDVWNTDPGRAERRPP
jgi:hypothetical protein